MPKITYQPPIIRPKPKTNNLYFYIKFILQKYEKKTLTFLV